MNNKTENEMNNKIKNEMFKGMVGSFLDHIFDTDMELPFLLMLWLNLNIAEILGLRFTDIVDGVLTIHRMKHDGLFGDGKLWINPAPGNVKRSYVLPDYLLRLIAQADHTQAYIVPLSEKQLKERMKMVLQQYKYELTNFVHLEDGAAWVINGLRISEEHRLRRLGMGFNREDEAIYDHYVFSPACKQDRLIDNFFNRLLAINKAERY